MLGNANALQGSNVTDSVTKGGLAFATSGVQYNIGSLAGAGSFSLTAVSGGSIALNVSETGISVYSGAMSGAGGLVLSSGSLELTASTPSLAARPSTAGARLC